MRGILARGLTTELLEPTDDTEEMLVMLDRRLPDRGRALNGVSTGLGDGDAPSRVFDRRR